MTAEAFDQKLATDPGHSAWVAANAGSGKTHVLVDRIARLLLSGSAPDRLMCLTFTRAAAAEMSTRLFKRLGQWTLLPDEALAKQLTDVTGEVPTSELMDRARRLFAEALESPGGLRIQTIHAFCERLLKRFPLEAKVVPQFEVLDERATEQLIEEAKDAVLARAALQDAELADSIASLTEYAGEERFDVLMRGIVADRGWIEPFLKAKSARQLRESLWGKVGLAPATSAASILSDAVALIGLDNVRRAADGLSRGSKTDKKRGQVMAQFARRPDRDGFDDVVDQFVTDAGKLRKLLATKGLVEDEPWLGDLLDRCGETIMATVERFNALFIAEQSSYLLHVAGAVLEACREIKSRRAMLDYDDLIGHAVALFESPGASWILYKLDGGIDHILVDEAQDTSPKQWKVITAIAAEFFAGLGADRPGGAKLRTVFAVGDVKQSIMSFQGARPAQFQATRDHVGEKARDANARFEPVELTRSYRTTPRILSLVDEVFKDEIARTGVAFDNATIHHEAVRDDIPGLVELWPTVKPPKVVETEAWDAPKDRVGAENPAVKLAQTIATRIEGWLAGGEAVFDKQLGRSRPMTPGDIMILVRRRNLLADEMIRQLKRRSIQVAGADRLKLVEHIAVMDLIALGRFALMPRDDLTLATVLKSPFCGLDDEALFEVAHGRTKPLWYALRDRKDEPRFAACIAFLERVWDRADVLPPYEFYSSILGELGGWSRMLARLGLDAADPIEEFLNAALDFERARTPSLEAFLHSIQQTQAEIKRDQDRGEGAVRVMTVHASKGLEAPVIILPDTTTTPRHGRFDRDLLQADETPLWKIETSRDEPVRRGARHTARDERLREYRRLLYVALTRARDRLYVCGYEGRDRHDPDSWYNLVLGAMGRLHSKTIGEGEDAFLRYGEASLTAAARAHISAPTVVASLPAWARVPAPVEAEMRHVEPSVVMPRRAVMPGGRGDASALDRGRAIHRALEQLASAPSERWSAIALQAASTILTDAAAAQNAAGEALKVRRDLLLSHLFAPGSYGEVPLRGVVEWQGVKVDLAARLDRVVVGERDVMIVEFKTDRVVPKVDSSIPASYVTQLALYRVAVARLFEGRPVNCAILWTAEPRLTVLPTRLLDAAGLAA
ncbi:MAG: double-strand break repair helicase AddA [Alphaproteobacteria bacterium]|nr:double-strand break repair helicase AddA [Alphaproteobacteria bacterium]